MPNEIKEKKNKETQRNTIIDKLVYCFEGKELEAPKSKWKRLINPYYFAGVYRGSKGNQKLWEEVYNYIDNTYDIEKIDNIFGQIYNISKTNNERKNINNCYRYFINNFNSICLRMIQNEEILGCSA